MKRPELEIQRPSPKHELAQIIEPLASYICAADRPRDLLRSALSVLFDEVKATNRAALIHVSCNREEFLKLVA